MHAAPAAWLEPCPVHAVANSCETSEDCVTRFVDALAAMRAAALSDPDDLHVVTVVAGIAKGYALDSDLDHRIDVEIHDGCVNVSRQVARSRRHLAGLDMDTSVLPAVADRASALLVVGIVCEIWQAHLAAALDALSKLGDGNPHAARASRIATALHVLDRNPDGLMVCAPSPWSPLAFANHRTDVDSISAGDPIDPAIWERFAPDVRAFEEKRSLSVAFQRYMQVDSYVLGPNFGRIRMDMGAMEAVDAARRIADAEKETRA